MIAPGPRFKNSALVDARCSLSALAIGCSLFACDNDGNALERLRPVQPDARREAEAVYRHFMADFRKLRVWQEANALSAATTAAVEGLRGSAGSILRVQLLRATFSIQANIAEGSSKKSDREFARYIRIALGSSTESANHLILLYTLGILDSLKFDALRAKQETVGKMLSGLEKRLSDEAPEGSAK